MITIIEKPKVDDDYSEGSLNWEVIQKAIDENKNTRINWKEILGVSLTEWAARLRQEKMTAEEIIKLTCNEFPFLRRKDYFSKLKIGVNARFGEMATAEGVKE